MGHQVSSGLYNCGHGPAPFNIHAQGHGRQGPGEAAGPHDGGHLQLALKVFSRMRSNLLKLEASMTRTGEEHGDMQEWQCMLLSKRWRSRIYGELLIRFRYGIYMDIILIY
jgi:hypothetical protein